MQANTIVFVGIDGFSVVEKNTNFCKFDKLFVNKLSQTPHRMCIVGDAGNAYGRARLHGNGPGTTAKQ